MSLLIIIAITAAQAPAEVPSADRALKTAATAERALSAAPKAFSGMSYEKLTGQKPVVRPDRFDRVGEPSSNGQ